MQDTGSGISLAFDFAVSITILSITGHIIDGKTGSSPWGLVVGLILGTAVGFYRLFKFLRNS